MTVDEIKKAIQEPLFDSCIETNGHNLDLIFHDLKVRELSRYDKEWVK